jgi:hypothetical protein
MTPSQSIESEVDRLYGLPVDAFVTTRDELARTLREQGDRDRAKEVKGLPKPTIAAWAVNQLARREKMNVRSLLSAGERLKAAQQELLERGSPESLERARQDERKAIGALTEAARKLLEEAGEKPSQSTLDRVDETLHAAALDPELADQVRQGRLARETRATGFGFGSIEVPSPAKGRGRATKEAPPRRTKQREAAEAKQQAAEERVREADRALREAERAADEQRRALQRAERELASRRSELETSEAALERARAALEKLG